MQRRPNFKLEILSWSDMREETNSQHRSTVVSSRTGTMHGNSETRSKDEHPKCLVLQALRSESRHIRYHLTTTAATIMISTSQQPRAKRELTTRMTRWSPPPGGRLMADVQTDHDDHQRGLKTSSGRHSKSGVLVTSPLINQVCCSLHLSTSSMLFIIALVRDCRTQNITTNSNLESTLFYLHTLHLQVREECCVHRKYY